MTGYQLKTNFIINVLGALARLVVALVTVPIYIRHVGDARYGVISIVWVLLGYFGFLDLGLSRAAANSMAKLRDATQEARSRVLVTTLVLNLGLGLSGSLCLLALGGYLLKHLIAVPDVLKPEIAQAFPWIIGLIPLALVSGVGIGALESRERFLLANLLQAAGMCMSQIVPVILAVAVSPSLGIVIPAAVIVQALSAISILVVVYIQEMPLPLSTFDRHQVRKLLSYGGWITVSSVIGPIIVSLDQLLIGSVLGVAAVAHYSVPMNLAIRSQVFASSLVRTLFPRMSGSSAAEAQNLACRALTSLAYGYATICAPAILLSPAFLRFWIGADFASVAAPVAEILFLGAWINGLALVPYFLLQSQGRPDVTGKLHAVEVLPFVAILWLSVSAFGITGAAAAWSLRCAVDAICLCWAARLPKRDLFRGIPPFFGLACCMILTRTIGPSLFQRFIAAAITTLLFTVLAYLLAEDLRRSAIGAIARAARFIRFSYLITGVSRSPKTRG